MTSKYAAISNEAAATANEAVKQMLDNVIHLQDTFFESLVNKPYYVRTKTFEQYSQDFDKHAPVFNGGVAEVSKMIKDPPYTWDGDEHEKWGTAEDWSNKLEEHLGEARKELEDESHAKELVERFVKKNIDKYAAIANEELKRLLEEVIDLQDNFVEKGCNNVPTKTFEEYIKDFHKNALIIKGSYHGPMIPFYKVGAMIKDPPHTWDGDEHEKWGTAEDWSEDLLVNLRKARKALENESHAKELVERFVKYHVDKETPKPFKLRFEEIPQACGQACG